MSPTAPASDRGVSITIPGEVLAPAWLNTSLASGIDDSQPALYRTVLVEVYPAGVQLVATDSRILVGTWAPKAGEDLTPPPAPDEAPDHVLVAIDTDRRARDLCKWVAGEAKKDRLIDIRLATRIVRSETQQTLDPTLDRTGLELAIPGEKLTLPLYDGEWLDWRRIVQAKDGKPTTGTAIAPDLLGLFGMLRNPPASISFDLDGPDGMIRWSAPGDESYLFGAVAPTRLHTADA